MAQQFDLKFIASLEDRASSQMQNMEKKLQGMSRGFGALTVASGAAFAGITAGIMGAVKAGIDFEQTTIAFETMVGSAEKAKILLGQLTDFASKTPFQLTQVETATKQLLAYGVSVEDIIPTLKTLGDISSGVGMDKLPNLILAFGQVKAATHLTGMELRQFTESGVPLLQALVDQANKMGGAMTSTGKAVKATHIDIKELNDKLAIAKVRLAEAEKKGKQKASTMMSLRNAVENYQQAISKANITNQGVAETFARTTVTAAQMQEAISNGEVTFEQVQKALQGMTTEGGKFNDLMLKQSATLGGMLSNLQDAIEKTMRSIGTQIVPQLKPLVEWLIEATAKVQAFAAEHPKLTTAIILAAAALTGLVALIGTIGLILPTVIAGFVLLAGPVGLIIVAIVALSAAITYLIIKWGEIRTAFIEGWTALKAIFKETVDWIIANTLQPLMDWINKVVSALSRVKESVSSVASKVGSGITNSIKNIIPFADGGIVTRPTLGLVGEAGPEAIVPLSKMGGFGGGLSITITGNTFMSDREAAEKIGNMIIKSLPLKLA
jgi:tape measure domain-containing protein